MLFRRFYTSIFLLSCIGNSFAQKSITDSVFSVDPIVVNSYRYQNMATGATVNHIDTLAIQSAQSQSLSDILFQQGGISVTSYGQGGLSSASVRGNSSNHTAVVWNDINLQSPMNGGVNLSVIPVCLIDNVTIQYGGSGVAYGSGAMSGIIHIGTENLFNQPNDLHFNAATGSFGNKILSSGGKFQTSKFASNIRVFAQQTDNDFNFQISTSKGPKFVSQTNAGLYQYGILQENQIKSSQNSVIKTSVWLQHYDKDLQTRMSADSSNANQKDNNLIITGNWKYLQSDYSVTCKSGLVYNQVLYKDELSVKTDNNSTSAIGEIEYKKVFGNKFSLHSGINNTYETAISNSYKKEEHRNRTSLYGSLKLNFLYNKAYLMFGVRNEAVDFTRNPFVYSIGCEVEPSKILKFKANVSTNYKLPTLNDLYWREDIYASGNPNLVPESGWSADAGFKLHAGENNFKIEFSNNFYYSKIKDWIIWEPNPLKKNKWMPQNRELGQSYGFEIRNQLTWKIKGSGIDIKNEYTYNISSILQKGGKNVNEPLLYNPIHHYMLSIGSSVKQFTLFYIQNIFSERLTDLAGGSLPLYYIADISIGKKIKLRNSQVGLSFRINNIWNAQYQIRRDYAMPMRNFMLSLSFNLNKNKEI